MRGLTGRASAEVRDTAAQLAALPTLRGVSTHDVRDLARSGRIVSLPANWPLIQERTPGDTCYLLLQGEAAVTVAGVERAKLGPGALVGEVGLLDARLRTATVVTRTPVRLFCMSFDQLEPLLARDPELAAALLADYHRRAGTLAPD